MSLRSGLEQEREARGRSPARGTSIEASLTATIASLNMPGYLLENGLSDAELATLFIRLTT